MKFDDLTYPHPILGISDSVEGNPDLLIDDIVITADDYVLKVTYILNNDELDYLVKNGKAEYYCEVNCTNTIYRRLYTSVDNVLIFKIPRKDVKGKVIITALLVAKQEIGEYKNRMFHPDYNDYSFDLDKGDLLAFFREFDFNADIKYEKLKAVSSFMEIVEDENIEIANIDLEKHKIEIQLPTNDYKIYSNNSISQQHKYASIFHSSIVLNALLIALYNINEYEDYLWVEVIRYRLENDEKLKNLNIEEKGDIPKIAQILLGNPFNRLLNGLSKMNDNQNDLE